MRAKPCFTGSASKALGVFLRLQRNFSPPAPSRKQDKTKIESTFGAEGDRYGEGAAPPPCQSPSRFMEAAYFCFDTETEGLWVKFSLRFYSPLKLF
ncbi:hypothetical protein A7X67_11725 [Clostridium sp. W14A]|nr:hypothetical protein A7X67_11725 [Clostridium sp. W14A]